MSRKIFFTALFFVCAFVCRAQTETVKSKILNHYIGVQANQLFKQLINLNASNTSISNPYLLTYSVYSVKCNWGLQTGFGYDYQRILDNDAPASHETKINNFFFRIGIGRKFFLGKKWEAGCGLDYVSDYQLNKTFSSSMVDFGSQTDSTASISISKTTSSGYGAQFTLGFHLSDKILLGTEATYYFLKSKIKHSVLESETIINEFNPESNTYTLTASNTGTEKSDFNFTVPVALFLIIKF